jgi:hypothetical protein
VIKLWPLFVDYVIGRHCIHNWGEWVSYGFVNRCRTCHKCGAHERSDE